MYTEGAEALFPLRATTKWADSKGAMREQLQQQLRASEIARPPC